jgi:hypothetical protein
MFQMHSRKDDKYMTVAVEVVPGVASAQASAAGIASSIPMKPPRMWNQFTTPPGLLLAGCKLGQ